MVGCWSFDLGLMSRLGCLWTCLMLLREGGGVLWYMYMYDLPSILLIKLLDMENDNGMLCGLC